MQDISVYAYILKGNNNVYQVAALLYAGSRSHK